MRGDIKDLIEFITKEDLSMYNKAELAPALWLPEAITNTIPLDDTTITRIEGK